MITHIASSAQPVRISSGTTVSAPFPAGIAAGDLIVASFFRRSSLTDTSGFTVRVNGSNNSLSQNTGIATKIATGTETGSLSFTQSSSGRMGLHISVFRFDGTIVFPGLTDFVRQDMGSGNPLMTMNPLTATGECLALWAASQVYYKTTGSVAEQLTPRPDATADAAWLNAAGDVTANDNRLGAAYGLFTDRTTAPAIFDFPAGVSGRNSDVGVMLLVQNDSPPVDSTPPILSTPTANSDGSGSVTTDEANGTLHSVVTISATPPSIADIKAGTGATYSASQAVSSTGVLSVAATNLMDSAAYHWHHVHTDAAGNDSNVVSVAFTYASMPWTVVLADNFDSAIGSGTVANATTATPAVTIVPGNTSNVSGWINQRLKVSGVLNKTPTFILDYSQWRRVGHYPQDTDYGMCWAYASDYEAATVNGRPSAVNKFATSNLSGLVLTSAHTSNFTENEIYVFAKSPWRYVDTQRAISYVSSSPMAFELPSSIAATSLPAHVFNQITVTGETDNSAPTGVPINLYGIGLDDNSVSPDDGKEKLNIAVFGGQHASEDQGDMQAWALMFYYIESTDAAAVWLRKNTRLYFYNPNPAGRYYGSERWTEETASDEDPNRAWDDSGSEQVNAVKAAIALDISQLDGLIDCHGDYRLNGNGYTQEFGGFYDSAVPAANAYRAALHSIVPGGYAGLGTTATNGTAQQYAYTLGAQFSITAENPYAADGYPDMDAMYTRTASHHAQALQSVVGSGEIVLRGGAIEVSPPSGSVSITGYAPSVETSQHVSVSPAVASLSVSGYAPIVDVSANVDLSPGAAAVTVSGYAPTVTLSNNIDVTPAAAEVSITGYAPVVVAGDSQVVQPGTGLISVSGFAPEVGISASVSPGHARISVSGFRPTVLAGDFQVVEVGAGGLSISGYAPVVEVSQNQVVEPQAARVEFTGFAPNIEASNDIAVYPGVARIVVRGFRPNQGAVIGGLSAKFKFYPAVAGNVRII